MNKEKYKLSLAVTFSCLVGGMFSALNAQADQYIQDDLVVVGSICSGTDCVNGENFAFDTIRLKENNLRIKFTDTSSSGGFPTNDWEILVNDSANGGLNRFSIRDDTANTIPFTILSGNANDAFYMLSDGRLGLGTTTPTVELEIKDGNSPTIRLSQDGTAGFTAQSWDVAGNETNFFIRDGTNNRIPFKIAPFAPTNSLYIAADGDVGIETSTPDGVFDVAHPSNANNHAQLISAAGYFGVNIDNGFVPNAQFEVQTTGGVSRLAVTSDGKVGINKVAPAGTFEVYNLAQDTKIFSVENTGNSTIAGDASISGIAGIGTSTPASSLHVQKSDGSASIQIEETNGTKAPRALLTLKNNGGSFITMENTDTSKQWYIIHANASPNDFMIQHSTGGQVFRLKDNGDLTITGKITTSGTTCNGGCDLVFSNDYPIESIEEHAESMWKNKYLPAVGKTIENQPFNLTEKTGGMLNELEKAHIYIDQLNQLIKQKDQEFSQKIALLEAKIEQLEANR